MIKEWRIFELKNKIIKQWPRNKTKTKNITTFVKHTELVPEKKWRIFFVCVCVCMKENFDLFLLPTNGSLSFFFFFFSQSVIVLVVVVITIIIIVVVGGGGGCTTLLLLSKCFKQQQQNNKTKHRSEPNTHFFDKNKTTTHLTECYVIITWCSTCSFVNSLIIQQQEIAKKDVNIIETQTIIINRKTIFNPKTKKKL